MDTVVASFESAQNPWFAFRFPMVIYKGIFVWMQLSELELPLPSSSNNIFYQNKAQNSCILSSTARKQLQSSCDPFWKHRQGSIDLKTDFARFFEDFGRLEKNIALYCRFASHTCPNFFALYRKSSI